MFLFFFSTYTLTFIFCEKIIFKIYFFKKTSISFFLSYVGKTSNVHALRMVGTLQDETDRLRIECETLKHEVQQLKTNVAIKNAEQDRWIEER